MAASAFDSLVAVASFNPSFTPKRGDETDQDYLHRLCDFVGGVPDDEWNKLTEEARQWYDSALDEDNRLKQELSIPEGYPVTPVETVTAPINRRRPVTPKSVVVYDEVLRVVMDTNEEFVPKHARETDQVYLGRLLRALPDTIPSSIQEWVSNADRAVEQNAAIPLPGGYTATEKDKDRQKEPEAKAAPAPKPAKGSNGSDGSAHVDADGNPLTGILLFNARLAAGEVTRRKRATKAEMAERAGHPIEPKAPRDPNVKQRRNRKPRADSTSALLRTALTQNPKLSVDDLQAMVKDTGKTIAVTTIASIRAAHLASLQTIQSLGWQPPAEQLQQQPAE